MPYKDIKEAKEYRERYYRENKEEIRKKSEIFRKNNLEKINERARKYNQRGYVKERKKKYAEAHKEEKSQYQKEYRKENREKMDKNHMRAIDPQRPFSHFGKNTVFSKIGAG